MLTAALAFGIALSAVSASAQEIASARAGVAEAAELPISARRAFLYSLALPGLGQARLDRPLVGAGFFLVEAFSLALIHRATDDLRLARAFSRDSVPLSFAINRETGVAQLDGNGKPVVAGWEPSRYSADLVQARRLQLEDWTAVLLFNHLIAGAEAFVAAQLWDLPQHVKVRATPVRGGFGIRAQFRTR
ncbi:MAG: hypothetical protein O2973_12305 [Gemmatimonadetes bacterium]|nr:hypothetical protein [Gemmatimonadota bacterium]